ncbi:MAG: T9SS type A sorting domain-containing protein [Bacteroidetes bacterium]|nr:T9SS type A sorting domain-containing protein [Bacteroidota bacterium]
MIKRALFITLLLITTVVALLAQPEKYVKIRIPLDDNTLTQLTTLGLPLEEVIKVKDQSMTGIFRETDVAKISSAHISFEVLIPDMLAYYLDQLTLPENDIRQINRMKSLGNVDSGYPVPEHFSLGSMGGFYTYEEALAKLDSLSILFPDLATPKTQIGSTTSLEGRPLYFVKISDNPNIQENEPEVFYNGLIHAREPIGMQLLFYFMFYMLENYATDEEVKYLVDNLQLYFVPIINPDGYYYNQSTTPQGGGMWRKNRRNSGSGNYGVDLNRNFGYMWGFDDIGSSPDPSSETYRGPSAFSEPETQIVRDFCNAHDFMITQNYHSYSNLLLYPWSYITQFTPDNEIFVDHALLMTAENGYTAGMPGAVLYNTNGDANDWMYGEQSSKPKILPYVPEVGNDGDNFWPQPGRIIPLCQENMLTNLLTAHLALRYAQVNDESPVIIREKEGYFKFLLKKHGLQDGGTYTVDITPLDNFITATGPAKSYSSVDILEEITDSIAYTLLPSIQNGQPFQYILSLSNGLFTWRDTITKYYGIPLVIFEDPCSNFENWVTNGNWEITPYQFHSPASSITDSKFGNYQNSQNSSVTTINKINLSNAAVAILNFWARWKIEDGYDYVQVKVSANNGINWTPLQGKYTNPGTSSQAAGQPVYDGIMDGWVKEEIDLAGFIDNEIKIRFTLISDVWTVDDGFYFDDLTVTIVENTVGVDEPHAKIAVSEPFPNPAGEEIQVTYSYPGDDGSLLLNDLTGKTLIKIPLDPFRQTVRIPLSNLTPGLYFYHIAGKQGNSSVRKVIIQ